MATPSVTHAHDRAPLGSPLDITYKFVVAPDAHFDQDYRVMVHVVDVADELIWTDDHMPPTPTSQWKPGQTVEYTRTIFVPVCPYVGEATMQVGLYSTTNQKRAAARSARTRASAPTRWRSCSCCRRPRTCSSVFKDGWHPAESAEHNASVEWQWTKKQATLAFKNPKKDATLYLDVDNPAACSTTRSRCRSASSAATVGRRSSR